jgi:histidine triad (HIT) family protein
MTMDCLFCKIIAGHIPCVKVYEDDQTLAFMDINPRSDGHCLIVPKTHAPTFFDIQERDLMAVMATAKRVAMAIKEALTPDGMIVYQLNGRVALQIVDHYHLHLVPRWENDGVDLTHGLQPGDIEKIKAIGEKISASLASKGSGR